MIFNSLTYLVFLALVVGLYWVLPRRPRQYMIFVASLVFYGFWRIKFLPVMLLSTIVDYFVSLRLQRTALKRNRNLLLLASLMINLGLLLYFKYLYFFASNVSSLCSMFGWDFDASFLKVILPLGISFYTFQTISYTVDVYRKKIEPERDFIVYAAFVTFFPQLVAGPILRASEVVSQLKIRSRFSGEDLGYGIRRILAGLFLKVVLADNIAGLVDSGFSQPVNSLSAIDVWTLSFLFGFQIYFDFSAYSHIAIGSARMMGIRFPENFNFPYSASSPKEFWKRWHISLSSWIRDYLYLPLLGAQGQASSTGGLTGLKNTNTWRKNFALFLTWAIMGFWHGANWTFVAWGLWHAVLVFGYRVFSSSHRHEKSRVLSSLGWVITLPLIMLGWIFFRSSSLTDAGIMFAKLIDIRMYFFLSMRENTYLVTALLAVFVMVVWVLKIRFLEKLSASRAWVFIETPLLAVAMTLVFIFLRPISQFIYFQF